MRRGIEALFGCMEPLLQEDALATGGGSQDLGQQRIEGLYVGLGHLLGEAGIVIAHGDGDDPAFPVFF